MSRKMQKFIKRYLMDRLWKKGWEEPVDPSNPMMQHLISRLGQSKRASQLFIEAIIAKDIAGRTKNAEWLEAASHAITSLRDDHCGTPWRRWPHPGPPPQVIELITELSMLAQSFQPGSLRKEIEELVTTMASRPPSAQRNA